MIGMDKGDQGMVEMVRRGDNHIVIIHHRYINPEASQIWPRAGCVLGGLSEGEKENGFSIFDALRIASWVREKGFISDRAYARAAAEVGVPRSRLEPNKTLEPTPTAVTDRAAARSAPAVGVAHL